MEKNVTIKEVARKGRVGIATVSRVLNNSERVAPHTRSRVLAVIRKLGYRPNAQGRRLAKRSSEMVCFILANRDFINSFHSGILYGAERFLNQSGHDVIFSNLYYAPSTAAGELPLPRILTNRGIADGVILSGTVHANLIEAVQTLRVPCVFLGNNVISERPQDRHMEARDAIYFEEAGAARAATELLVRLGHRHIWFVGDRRMPWFQRRLTEPMLTTVHVPSEQIGAECAAMLLEKLRARGRPQPPRVIPTHVVERFSCGPAPAAGCELRMADGGR